MIHFHARGQDAIRRASTDARRGLICTPYYSERGLALLDSFFDSAELVEFWTRLSPLDWKAGVADMAALKKRVDSIVTSKRQFDLRVSDDLHAKIYRFSDDRVVIGSANLTWLAMTSNIEVVCELTEDDATRFASVIRGFRDRLTPVPTGTFTAYVEVVADAVASPADLPVEEDAELNAAIDLAEEQLRDSLAPTAISTLPPAQWEIGEFIDYCRQENASVAHEVIARHEGRHNLQGHVKHCFYGSIRFLSAHPDFVRRIAQTPPTLLYDFADTAVRGAWRDFLRHHADEIDAPQSFSFRTLRVYLPANLGGACTGGGGGSSTLKRVLPIVARMISDSGRRNAEE